MLAVRSRPTWAKIRNARPATATLAEADPGGAMTETRDLIPTLTGPIRSTQQSHQFNSTPTYDVPLDLSKFGFVEEEFFVLGQQLSTPTTSASSRRCRTPTG
jgi:hypothetical protein